MSKDMKQLLFILFVGLPNLEKISAFNQVTVFKSISYYCHNEKFLFIVTREMK